MCWFVLQSGLLWQHLLEPLASALLSLKDASSQRYYLALAFLCACGCFRRFSWEGVGNATQGIRICPEPNTLLSCHLSYCRLHSVWMPACFPVLGQVDDAKTSMGLASKWAGTKTTICCMHNSTRHMCPQCVRGHIQLPTWFTVHVAA